MAVERKLFLYAGIITVLLFVMIYSLNVFLSREREDSLSTRMDSLIDDFEEMQALFLMSGIFDTNGTCIALQTWMSQMDKSLWDLGIKLDQYQKVTEEYLKDPFYLEQKKKFNRRQVIYYSILKEAKDRCSLNATSLLFFYRKSEECPDCDAMSFVLTDLKREVNEEVAIFSFDTNLDLPSIQVLPIFFNVTSYPCIVVEGKTHCGLYNKNELTKFVCDAGQLSICS